MLASTTVVRDAYRLDAQLMSDLWVFRAAARHGSFTSAAEALLVTQGAVSQRVLRLEGRLGVSLFVRHTSGVSLTEAGETLVGAMNQVSMVLNAAVGQLDGRRGGLVVSCVPSLAGEWLARNLSDFYRQHPDVEITLRAEMSPASADAMAAQGVDLAIDYALHRAADLYELACIPEHLIPVCSPGYLAGLGGADVTLLSDVSPWPGAVARAEWDMWAASLTSGPDLKVGSHRLFNQAQLAYEAAIGGQGVAVGRAALVAKALARGELVPAAPEFAPAGAAYRLLASRPGAAGSPLRLFARWFEAGLKRAQGEAIDAVAAFRRPTRLRIAG